MRAFGQRLKAARLKSGVPTAEVAARLKVTRENIYMYEMGKSTPPLDKLLLLEEIYAVVPGSLIRASEHANTALNVAKALGGAEHAAV